MPVATHVTKSVYPNTDAGLPDESMVASIAVVVGVVLDGSYERTHGEFCRELGGIHELMKQVCVGVAVLLHTRQHAFDRYEIHLQLVWTAP